MDLLRAMLTRLKSGGLTAVTAEELGAIRLGREFGFTICGGAGLMEEENGWCFYAACLDCGAHTAEIRYERDAERLDAAQRAAHLWNIGKVLTDTPND